MPCGMSNEDDDCDEDWKRREEIERDSRIAQRAYQRKEIDKREKLLCSACRVLESKDYDFGMNPELDRWWAEHKEEDLKREEAEAKKIFQRNYAVELAKKPFNELASFELDILREQGYFS